MSNEDRKLFLSCLAIAFGFWVIVKLSRVYEISKPIQFYYEMPMNRVFTEPPTPEAEAVLEGSGWALLFEYLNGSTIDLRYELGQESRFRLTSSQVSGDVQRALSSGDVSIKNLIFNGIDARIQDRATKRVAVRPRISVSYAEERQPGGPVVVSPDSVEISGPAVQIASIESWPTDSIAFADLTETRQTTLSLTDSEENLRVSPRTVDVTVPVETVTQKSLYLPVEVRNAPADSLRLFPDRVQVQVRVGTSDYNSIVTDSFTLVADLANISLAEGKNTVPLVLERRPGNVSGIRLQRRSVEFYVIRRELPDQTPDQ
jgi:hypothetical protein